MEFSLSFRDGIRWDKSWIHSQHADLRLISEDEAIPELYFKVQLEISTGFFLYAKTKASKHPLKLTSTFSCLAWLFVLV